MAAFVAPLRTSNSPIAENVYVAGEWFPGLTGDLNDDEVVIRLLHAQLTADLLQRLEVPER